MQPIQAIREMEPETVTITAQVIPFIAHFHNDSASRFLFMYMDALLYIAELKRQLKK